MDKPKRIRYVALEIALLMSTLIAGLSVVWTLYAPVRPSLSILMFCVLWFLVSIVLTVRFIINPDNVRARQSDAVLDLARDMLACMNESGLTPAAAQEICALLLPASQAIAVAITDETQVLGYAGVTQVDSHSGSPIRTAATHTTLEEATTQILLSPEEIGFPRGSRAIRAGIIVPLVVQGKAKGTLKFYFKNAGNINETQISIAEGFGELLSTQLAASELEAQTKLATRMELRALQSQINPHFLFNTINTIASLIRTNPDQARLLLREFAIFYRRTLENSSDLIKLEREIEQTQRYFGFEVARFGEDRVELQVDIQDDLEDLMIPAFMLQPLVENAVRHGMPSEGLLSITIRAWLEEDNVIIEVKDNGVGFSAEPNTGVLETSQTAGMGLAIRNINERIRGYYYEGSGMEFISSPGKGCTVRLLLCGALEREQDLLESLDESKRLNNGLM